MYGVGECKIVAVNAAKPIKLCGSGDAIVMTCHFMLFRVPNEHELMTILRSILWIIKCALEH